MKGLKRIYTALLCVFAVVATVSAEQVTARLEGIYATNTALPISKNHVSHILDNDPKTYWRTPTGAGSGEGVMLRFAEPVFVGALKLESRTGGGLASAKTVTVYCDGVVIKSKHDAAAIAINTRVSNLFIKVEDLRAAGTEVILKENSEYGSRKVRQTVYPENASVNISELKLFGSKNKPIVIIPHQTVGCEISASSTLSPELGYSAYNLVDSKLDFGWSEGAKGSGKGEWVRFTFEQDVKIFALKIWNGYQRSSSHFVNNSRAREISFGVKGDTAFQFTLEDTREPQLLQLPEPLSAKEFTLEVKGVYAGKRYADLVLSEILFYSGDSVIVPLGSYEAEKVAGTTGIENKQLQKVLDRKIDVSTFSGDEAGFTNATSDVSLIIRSNNSFVYYENKMEDNEMVHEQQTVIGEGGWELVAKSDSPAQIRIFGKLYATGSREHVYKGSKERQSTNIFQDFLTISDDFIAGKNYIEPIPLIW
ncbi:MAG: NADase-type glycan-binding domain-containing protein [Chitinispirillaceae bacterium]